MTLIRGRENRDLLYDGWIPRARYGQEIKTIALAVSSSTSGRKRLLLPKLPVAQANALSDDFIRVAFSITQSDVAPD